MERVVKMDPASGTEGFEMENAARQEVALENHEAEMEEGRKTRG
jgi:hypothetical protein